ncbi:MAG: hypothetical protein IT373_17675 [Polyangiaceae bacterium]|nr:hypothetical protein [Polyangiaceae bacterium]
MRRLAAYSTFALVTAASALARADASGWMHTAGGVYGWQMVESGDFELSPTLAIDAGLGSDPDQMFIGGFLFRVQPIVGHGTDLELMARFCNGTFQTDWVGFALDAGLYQRFWGAQSTGFVGEAVLGLPFGFELTALGSYGTHDAKGFAVTLGIDVIRLTVDRRYLTDWWQNPQSTDAMQTALASDAALGRGL